MFTKLLYTEVERIDTMKILVLNGSPKPVSDTMHMTRAFLEGLKQQDEQEIDMIDVISKNIRPCRGCFLCWRYGNGKCIQNDDQNMILEKYAAADLVIWSFPLYCYGMPSHLKAVLDRIIPLVSMKMTEENGIVRHVPIADFSRIRHMVISGCGFPQWEHNFDGLKLQCENAFGNLTAVFVPETPLMNNPEAAPVVELKLKRFTEAGKEYAKFGMLNEETVRELETPMIPKNVYIKGVNG